MIELTRSLEDVKIIIQNSLLINGELAKVFEVLDKYVCNKSIDVDPGSNSMKIIVDENVPLTIFNNLEKRILDIFGYVRCKSVKCRVPVKIGEDYNGYCTDCMNKVERKNRIKHARDNRDINMISGEFKGDDLIQTFKEWL